MAEKAKLIIWLGDSRKVVRLFPTEVRQHIGVALYDTPNVK